MSKTLKILLPILAILIIYPILSSYIKPYGVSNANEGDRIHQLAIQNRDISICDKIHLKGFGDVTDAELIGSCYMVYAAALPQENVCPRLIEGMASKYAVDSNFDSIDYSLCIEEQAKGAQDPNMCTLLENRHLRASCVVQVARKKNDFSVCSILSNKEDQQECLGFEQR